MPSQWGHHGPRLQDVRFALRQRVEIALRGLASGTDDPYTAVAALDIAASALVPLWSRPEAGTGLPDENGDVLVITHWRPAPVHTGNRQPSSLRTAGFRFPLGRRQHFCH